MLELLYLKHSLSFGSQCVYICHQPEKVNQEKKSIYDPCIPYFQSKFNLKEVETIGLYIGARGTISNFFVSFLKRFRIPMKVIEERVPLVLKSSALICNKHLYKS